MARAFTDHCGHKAHEEEGRIPGRLPHVHKCHPRLATRPFRNPQNPGVTFDDSDREETRRTLSDIIQKETEPL